MEALVANGYYGSNRQEGPAMIATNLESVDDSNGVGRLLADWRDNGK